MKMEESPSIEVKIVSKEVVKPLIPTPCDLRNFKVSYVDQITIPSHTCGLLFYNFPTQAQPQAQPVDITRLKTSLSKTLTHFYPLAGRVVNESTIVCNDEGIPFVETRPNCTLSAFLSSPRMLDLLPMLLPTRDSVGNLDLLPNTQLIHLSYQVNIFTCGGVVLSWYDIHKITDGTSAITFLKHWAAIARSESESESNSESEERLLLQPNLDAAIKAFPPLPKLGDLLPLGEATKDHIQDSPTVVKSFIFSNTAVKELKARARSQRVPNPSRLQAVGGFIWERALHVSIKNSTKNEQDTILYLTIDMRQWMNPPLPKESIGNLATMAVAKAENNATLKDLVAEIHTGVSNMKQEIKGYQGETAVETLRQNWNNRINALSKYNDRAYKLVSWCNVGFNDLDFGFGKPKWVVPTDGIMTPIHNNLFVLNDYIDSEGCIGVEAWLFLEAKEMEILGSDQQFLTLAKLYNPIFV